MNSNDEEKILPLTSAKEFALARIADALKCDVAKFHDVGVPRELAQFSEMVYLWGRVRDLDCRERVLDMMREYAFAESSAEG